MVFNMKKINLTMVGLNSWQAFKVVLTIAAIATVWIKGGDWLERLSPSGPSDAEVTRVGNVMRLQNKASKARFKGMVKGMSGTAVMKVAKDGDGNIREVGRIRAEMTSSAAQTDEADAIYKDPEVATRSHVTFDLYRDMPDGGELSIGWVKYHPATGEMTQFFYPLKYEVVVIDSELRSGGFEKHVSAEVENDYLVAEKGKKHALKLSDVKFERRPLSGKRFSLNPRVSLDAVAGEGGVFPALDVSFWSYGRTHADITWRFGGIGLGASGLDGGDYQPTGVLIPVQWNIGQVVPVVENLFIGPAMTLDTEGGIGWGGQFSIPF